MCNGVAKHDSEDDCSKSDGQSCVCEISGDTRESVNKLDQELVDTCSTQNGRGQTGPVFSSEASKEAEQTVVMVRLSEEIIQTSQQTKEK